MPTVCGPAQPRGRQVSAQPHCGQPCGHQPDAGHHRPPTSLFQQTSGGHLLPPPPGWRGVGHKGPEKPDPALLEAEEQVCRGGAAHKPGTVVFTGTQGQGGSGTGPTQEKMQSASQSPTFVLNSTSVPAGHFLWRRSWLWRGARRTPPARFPEEALDPLETHRVVHCLHGILAWRASVIVSV